MKILLAIFLGTISLTSFAQDKKMSLFDLFNTGYEVKATVVEPQGLVIEADSPFAVAGRCIISVRTQKDTARVIPKGRTFNLKNYSLSDTLFKMESDDKAIEAVNISSDYPIYRFSDLNCAGGLKFEIVARENLEEI